MSDKLNEESTQDKQDNKDAAVKFPPPAIFASCIFLGAGFQYLRPVGLGISESIEIFGYLLVLFGITITILVATSFRRAGTAIEPWKPTTSIVTTGFYAWSRNSIYAGFCLINIVIGIASNSIWIFVSFIPAAFLLYHVAIAKEEAYLAEKFGEECLTYKNKVRRWV
jgi:protein-S-isoprenylcysteine O-methyltransferase Ste14